MNNTTEAASPPAFRLQQPDAASALPLLIDSPHSGIEYPPQFDSLATAAELATAWDAWVAELWQGAAAVGGTILEARFPRVVIDPNRAPTDIDPELLDSMHSAGDLTSAPTIYSERGMGLIRRLILPGKPMYAVPLTDLEVHWRIDNLYTPYHTALMNRLDALRTRFGQVWHLDCHSMKSSGNAMNIDNGQIRPDVVLGDLNGASCAPEFSDLVAAELERLGYSVARNNPYKGGYIVQHYGSPSQGIHSLQVELNRALYMDEKTCERSADFPRLQANLGTLCSLIADYIHATLPDSATDLPV